MGDIAGIDVAKVSAWLEANIPGSAAPFTFELIAGGRSNLTFRVSDSAGNHYALRRPPVSHVLPTAHDMAREHRIISALGPTKVPVAPALGLCKDPDVNGAPFYVMGFVDGVILRDATIVEKVYDEPTRRVAGERLIDVLADLHAVDVDAIGLGELGRKEGYIERQLKRWYGQFQQSAALGGRTVSSIDEMHEFLSARIPEQQGATIVHGDYRLDNTMFDDAGNVLAVLDWEICTLGDPLADLGLLMVYWAEPGEDPPLGVAPTAVPGFPTKAELRTRYSERSGRDVSHLDFYISFGYWKLACILEGVYARYAGGASGGDSAGWEAFGVQVERLGDWAVMAAEKL
jgi:aminoglycoside phosphotransferase (APT) family kinase protein